MDYFIDNTFLKINTNYIWSKSIVTKIFETLENFEKNDNPESKERRFTEFFIELKVAYNKFLQNIKDLPLIMNCRVKGDIDSKFGGEECLKFAQNLQNSCNKYLHFSSIANNFVEGSIEQFILTIKEKAKKEEKIAIDFENQTKQNYLISGNDNTLEILKQSGYNFE